MPLVTVQYSQLSHNIHYIHSTNYFFIYMMSQFAKGTEYKILDSFTLDNNFLRYL